jgi:hypothetical protein
MAATKLQLNWLTVAHGATAITRVTSVNFSQGGTLIEYAGDNDKFSTVIVNGVGKPTASVTSADAAVLMGIASGTTATLTATHKDAKLASGGDILYSLVNAVAQNATTTGAFNQFGSATLSFMAYSSDGSTNPLSFTRA